MYLCGFTQQRIVPYVGYSQPIDFSRPLPPYVPLPWWNQTTYTNPHGYRCPDCIERDTLDHYSPITATPPPPPPQEEEETP